MKKSFILHIDSLEVVGELSNDQKAELFQAIIDYNMGKEIQLSGLMKAIFIPFKNQFLRDDEKYSKIVKRNSENGKNGGRPNEPKETQENPNNPVGLSETQANPKKAYNDNDSDNDSKNDNDNENKNVSGSKKSELQNLHFAPTPKKNKSFKSFDLEDFQKEITEHRAAAPTLTKDDLREFYNYWSELNSLGKMRLTMERTWETDKRLQTWERKKYSFQPSTMPRAAPKITVSQFE